MSRAIPFAVGILILAAVGGPAMLRAGDVLAARPAGDEGGVPASGPAGDKEPGSPFSRWRTATSVEQIQRVLADMGLYLGPVDGHLNDETRAAIRVYQQGAGLKVDGKVTRELWDLLNNASRVRALLRRHDKARRTGRDVARRALLSHPATRDLVDVPNRERADPTRNIDACFNEPTVRCLLAEASESAKAVFRPELRDWALGEILVAEARAGLTENAMQTVRRIRDPRLIMVALRDIAEAEAASGRAEEARAAAEIIPDHDKQADALAAIAGIQVQRKEHAHARDTVQRLLDLIEDLEPAVRRVALRSRAAVILAQSGDEAGARRNMDAAEAEARGDISAQAQATALRHVASALADMSRPADAISVVADISSDSERTSALVSTAEAQVRAGDAAAALATADGIETVRFKAAVLGRIAQSQAQAGDNAGAEATIKLALAAIDNISSAFARSYAISRVALAMASTGGGTPAFDKATETSKRIEDGRLRAQTLWSITAERRRVGDTDGAAATEAEAEDATDLIVSRLSQVWMFSDIALVHARHARPDDADDALRRALDVARSLENAWSRSRALARLAVVLMEIVTPNPDLPLAPPR